MRLVVVGVGARPFPSTLLLLWSLLVVACYHSIMVVDGALSQADQGPYLGKYVENWQDGWARHDCMHVKYIEIPPIGLINSRSRPPHSFVHFARTK